MISGQPIAPIYHQQQAGAKLPLSGCIVGFGRLYKASRLTGRGR